MNKLLVICALVALIEAAPQVNRYYNQQQQQQYQYNPSYKQPLILRQTQNINPDGSYEYAYDTENGISAQERGALRQFSPQEAGEVAQGSFSYTAPDGQVIQVQYVADENGFQPQGAHIPTPPPIPAEILRSIQYIESVEQKQQKPYRF